MTKDAIEIELHESDSGLGKMSLSTRILWSGRESTPFSMEHVYPLTLLTAKYVYRPHKKTLWSSEIPIQQMISVLLN